MQPCSLLSHTAGCVCILSILRNLAHCNLVLQALHAFCLADVTLCMPPNDPASFARCLASYLKVPPADPTASAHEKRRGAERLLCILSIISSLLLKLDRLAPEAAQDLESDLVQLINAHHYVQVGTVVSDSPLQLKVCRVVIWACLSCLQRLTITCSLLHCTAMSPAQELCWAVQNDNNFSHRSI